MNVTEAEAMKRWCPFARVLVEIRAGHKPGPDSPLLDAPAAFNRKPRLVGEGPEQQAWPMGAICMGSNCMSWRWTEPYYEQAGGDQKPEGDGWEKIPDSGPAFLKWRRIRTDRKGRCGLAGPAEYMA